MTKPKYPHIEVKLVGTDGNAFALLGLVTAALRKNGVNGGAIQRFQEQAKSADYDQLLRTLTAWVTVL